VPAERSWTFLSNHTHVLVCLAEDPEARQRDIAMRVGVTERAVSGIIADLEADGYLQRERVGRRNRYKVLRRGRLRHPLEKHQTVGQLLDAVTRRD
jgi:DNA-binding MarR family transcriptional regulator